jgi:hypothetical protein
LEQQVKRSFGLPLALARSQQAEMLPGLGHLTEVAMWNL